MFPPRGNISHESGQTGADAGDRDLPSLAGPSAQVEFSPGGAPSATPALICFSSPTLRGTAPHVNKTSLQSPTACCWVRKITFMAGVTGEALGLGTSVNHDFSRSGGTSGAGKPCTASQVPRAIWSVSAEHSPGPSWLQDALWQRSGF